MTERLTEKFKDGRNILRKGIENIHHVGFGQFYAGETIDKLSEYETAEDEGRLVVLPCKVGDSLFCFSRGNIYTFKVRCIRIYEKRTEIELWYEGNDESYKFWHITIDEKDIGYKFFFTYEEADKVWKEANNE